MANRKDKILIGIYSSSLVISMTALLLVGALEIFMLVYTIVDPALFGEAINQYRAFYIALLALAIAYIALSFFVKQDIEHRYKLFSIANPVCAIFMFAWGLGITYFDAMKFGAVDAMVFMTFSLTVPLIFYLFPTAYAAIAITADILMLYLTAVVSGSAAPLINLSIFFVFQLVLGASFLRLKVNLAERIVEEQENADIDIMTGFPNRRVYEEDLAKLLKEPLPSDLVYIAIDINGLKETNDRFGHEAGDNLIIGSAQCIEQCFGEAGKKYRIGGDEFVVLINTDQDHLKELLSSFEQRTNAWSNDNGLSLSISYGFVYRSEYPDGDIAQLARVADKRMYAAKTRYYQANGIDRRRYISGESELANSSFTG